MFRQDWSTSSAKVRREMSHISEGLVTIIAEEVEVDVFTMATTELEVEEIAANPVANISLQVGCYL